MTPELKEKLLIRLFSSLEYIEEFCEHFDKWMGGVINRFESFEQQLLIKPSLASKHKLAVSQWRDRVIPNFKGMREDACESLKMIQQGKTEPMIGTTGNLQGLSKDMDGISWDWWDEIDDPFNPDHTRIGDQMASNIYYTLAGYWRPGELLNEEITGKIDEKKLLKHLKPGEQV
jgi:hypothetical protein